MKKILLSIALFLSMASIAHAAPFNSQQLATTTLINGYVLQTNGSNNTWVSTSSLGISGGSGGTSTSQWTTNGTQIYYDIGNVNIGTTSSTDGLFNIFSQSTTSPILGESNIGSTTNYLQTYIQNTSSSGNASEDYIAGESGGNSLSANYYGDFGCQNIGTNPTPFTGIVPLDCYVYDTDGGLDLGTATTSLSSIIRFFTGGLATANQRMVITSTGFVGIGTTTPDSPLSIVGTTTTGRLKITTITGTTSCLQADTNGVVSGIGSPCGSSSGGSGTVTSITAGTGLSGGTITTSGTITNTGVLSIGGLTGAVATSSLGLAGNLIRTSQFWADPNRNDTYTANGTIQFPYGNQSGGVNAFSSLLTGVTNSKVGGATAYLAASTTYIESSPTLPNIPMTINADQSTIITGLGTATGTISFPNQFTWNDGVILGSVSESDLSTSTPHTFEDTSAILGNITTAGLFTMVNGTQLPFLNGATTTLVTGVGGITNLLGDNLNSSLLNNGGTTVVSDNLIQCVSSSPCIIATTTNAQDQILGANIINTGGGGCTTFTNNNMFGNPHTIENVNCVANGVPFYAATGTNSYMSNYIAHNLSGTQTFAQGGGWIAIDNPAIESDGNADFGFANYGTTTVHNPLVVSLLGSTGNPCVTVASTSGLLATSTCGGGGSGTVTTITAGTGITLSSGSTCTTTCTINSTGGTNYWTNSGAATTTLTTGSIAVFNTFQATSTTGTSTVAGALAVGTTTATYPLTVLGDVDLDNGLLHASSSQSVLTLNTVQEGAPVFANDAGIVRALDLPIVSATNNTIEAYDFALGGTSTLMLWGQSNGSGVVKNIAVGIATSTPSQYFTIASSTNTNLGIKAIDSAGHMLTYGTASTSQLSACGTNPSISGDDSGGVITIGSGVTTACTFTFLKPFPAVSTVYCTEADNSTAVTGDITSLSTTSVTFGFSATLGSGVLYYTCAAHMPN